MYNVAGSNVICTKATIPASSPRWALVRCASTSSPLALMYCMIDRIASNSPSSPDPRSAPTRSESCSNAGNWPVRCPKPDSRGLQGSKNAPSRIRRGVGVGLFGRAVPPHSIKNGRGQEAIDGVSIRHSSSARVSIHPRCYCFSISRTGNAQEAASKYNVAMS